MKEVCFLVLIQREMRSFWFDCEKLSGLWLDFHVPMSFKFGMFVVIIRIHRFIHVCMTLTFAQHHKHMMMRNFLY